MNNKDALNSKIQQIIEMPVNVDTIKATRRVASSRRTESSFYPHVMQWNYIQALLV